MYVLKDFALGEMVDMGVVAGVLDKSGAWYTFNGERIAQGREKAKQYFEQNAASAETLEKAIREKLLNDPAALLGAPDLEGVVAPETPESNVEPQFIEK